MNTSTQSTISQVSMNAIELEKYNNFRGKFSGSKVSDENIFFSEYKAN